MSCSYPLIQPNPTGTSGAGSGTVTSVGLSLPGIFTVSGSPVTTSGTLTGTLATQTAGKIFAAPPTTTGTPTFQQITAPHLNGTFTNGQVLTTNGSGVLSWTTVGGSGTVTSVALSLPTELTVTGSPVTTSGTLTGTWADQNQNLIFAAPAGGTGTPSFQQIVANHLNGSFANTNILQTDGAGVLSWVAKPTGTVTSVALSLPTELTVTGSPITTSGTLTGAWATQTAGKIFSAPATTTGTPTFKQIVAEHLNATYTNGYVLTTNGSGVLSWTALSGGTPASPTNSIQYNNAGAFGGSSNLTFDGTALTYNNTANAVGCLITQGASGTTSVALEVLGGTNLVNESVLYVEQLNLGSTNVKIAYFCRGTSNSTRAAVHINDYPTSTPQPALLVTASSSNSSTVESNSPVLSAWNNRRIGVRLPTNPTNGIVEIPWVTGDTLPTLYVGDTSSNKNAIKAISGSFPATIDVTNSSSTGTGIIADAAYGLIVNCNYANGYAITANATSTSTIGLYVADGSNSRTVDLVQINSYANNTSNALRIWDASTNFLTTTSTGKTSVRNGLATDNKMVDVGGVYYTSTTDVGNVGAGEDDLSNTTLGASMLGTNGDRIEIEGSFTFANNANTKTLRLYFGSTKILDFATPTNAAGTLVVKATVIRVDGTNQKCYVTLNRMTSSGAAASNYVAATETLSSSVVVKFTGEATSDDDIVETTFTIKYYPEGGA